MERPRRAPWTDRQDMHDEVLAPISERLFARARVAPGDRIIDVGCGCGGTTLEVARRVGAKGRVIGLDISLPMVARARERTPADAAVEFVLADATAHAFAPEWANLLFSRFGVMFFADPALSFAEYPQGSRARRALRLRVLARAQAQSLADDRVEGDLHARAAPAGRRSRGSRPVLLRQ